MKQFEFVNDGIIRKDDLLGFLEWTSETECRSVTKLTLSFGGGLGGSTRTLIVKKLSDIPSNQLFQVTKLDGTTETINTQYIVYAQDFILVTRDYLARGICYCEADRQDPKNRKTRTLEVLINSDETVKFVDNDTEKPF